MRGEGSGRGDTLRGVNDAVTLKTLRAMSRAGTPFACLTCYDATFARWLAKAGVHVLLVGDTAAEMVLGHARTLDMPLDVLVELTAGVKRGAPGCVVMADMPFLSYHGNEDEALANAGKFLTRGQADIVKLEADASFAGLVRKMARAGIPVCAHVGSRPQRSAMTGGYAGAGRTEEERRGILEDAKALEEAGAVMLLVEAVPPGLGDEIVARAGVPVIGIGAGSACHGQVLVLQDVLGLTEKPPPFAVVLSDVGEKTVEAAKAWVGMVARREVGGIRGGAQSEEKGQERSGAKGRRAGG